MRGILRKKSATLAVLLVNGQEIELEGTWDKFTNGKETKFTEKAVDIRMIKPCDGGYKFVLDDL